MRHITQNVVVIALAILVGCGGGTQTMPTGATNPVGQLGLATPEGMRIQYATAFSGTLPQDSLRPWEQLSPAGYVIPQGNKGVSATSGSSEFFAGTQTDFERGDTFAWNGALRMQSGGVGEGNLSSATYRIPLGGSEPGVVSVDANLRPMGDGKIGGYYVGLADFGNNSWQWFGPVTDAHWRVSILHVAREDTWYTSELGSVFVCVAVHEGAALDVVGVGVDPVDPADSTAPDAPPAPTLTPVAGGLLVGWTAFAGGDIGGYKVYYKDSAYTELTAFSANTLDILHGSLVRLGLDEYIPRKWWVALSTVDLSGNESSISPVVSTTPLPSAGSLPPVWIELDNASALINQPIGMAASGADAYDWDTDGDGIFDILGDETGTQNIDTSSPGIIRPMVRGNSSGGSFIALSAVSVLVTSNARPVVQGFVDPAFGVAPLEVQFTSIHIDFDGEVVEWTWDFFGDNSVNFRYSTAEGAENPAPYTFNTPGLYNAKVRVWDDAGAWDVDTVAINVLGNLPPVAIIFSPLESEYGKSVTFNAQQSFDQDGTIMQYEWDLDGNGSYEFDSSPLFLAETYFSDPGDYEIGLRVTDNLAAQGTTSILLRAHGAVPVNIDNLDDVGEYTSMAVVDGNPAISYHDRTNRDLKFVRAADAQGKAWNTPISVDTGGDVGRYTSMAVVDGNPAISYKDVTNFNLMYVRATNASGTTWGTPIVADSIGDAGFYTSLVVVDGNPAISYMDNSSSNLKYVRATNAQGGAWGAPLELDTSGLVGQFTSMAVSNGNPAISYFDITNGDLKFVRATNPQGTAWNAPIAIDTIGNVGAYTSMEVVDGNPAISYLDITNFDLKYVRATNATGTSWGTPLALDTDGIVGYYSSLAVVDGNPAISYYYPSGGRLNYIRAKDTQGSTWETPIDLDSAGAFTSLAVVGGNPAISYQNLGNDDLKYVMLY